MAMFQVISGYFQNVAGRPGPWHVQDSAEANGSLSLSNLSPYIGISLLLITEYQT
jgi:hypothetical protein